MEMQNPTLFIEINNSEYFFAVGDLNKEDEFKLLYKYTAPIRGIENSRISDFDLVYQDIKKNIYLIEQKLNFVFKETILIINNFHYSFINYTGYKKLNGSQILKENITYILNSLKSNIDKIENKKSILHIFNSEYSLDRKKIKNLPIGLFGDFYSHELSFCLINNNDLKSIKNIFHKCNLRIRKIILKSFVEGAYISNENKDIDTFFYVKINKNNSQITYFENDALKFDQNFNFGSEIVLKDISKVTSLKIDIIKKIIDSTVLTSSTDKDELIEKNLFKDENYIKIKKRLLYQIAEARIEEVLERVIIKNINLLSFSKKKVKIFVKISDQIHFNCFKGVYSYFFSKKKNLQLEFIKNVPTKDLMYNVYKLVYFGWKKEAIPITNSKKSVIARFFDALFN